MVSAHERSGDLALEQHLYDDAAQRYQKAVGLVEPFSIGHVRIREKLSYAQFRGNNPSGVGLLDLPRATRLEMSAEPNKAVALLLQLVMQLWTDAKVRETPPLISQAIRIADKVGDPRLRNMANLRMANHLCILGRFEEAVTFLDKISKLDDDNDHSLATIYYSVRGLTEAAFGKREAYQSFDRAVRALGDDVDPYRFSSVWESYAYCAAALGDTVLAKTCIEKALLVARQYQIVWRIPYLCITYANLLRRMGQYELAYSYLLSGVSYDTKAPIIDMLRAEVGIPLSLYMKDEATLMKCAHPQTLDLALESEVPEWVASVSAAFARLYSVRGDFQEAQTLLHRALEFVHPLDQMHDLVIAIAQHGAADDIPRSRQLLEARAALPSSEVARACLSVFEAYVSRRKRRTAESRKYTDEAIERCEALQWYGYADMVRSQFPALQVAKSAMRDIHPFADLPRGLTIRERQVVELVLKGFTNREIASALLIKERTVEAHMTSILGYLGLRSRYQIVEHFGSTHDLSAVSTMRSSNGLK